MFGKNYSNNVEHNFTPYVVDHPYPGEEMVLLHSSKPQLSKSNVKFTYSFHAYSMLPSALTIRTPSLVIIVVVLGIALSEEVPHSSEEQNRKECSRASVIFSTR